MKKNSNKTWREFFVFLILITIFTFLMPMFVYISRVVVPDIEKSLSLHSSEIKSYIDDKFEHTAAKDCINLCSQPGVASKAYMESVKAKLVCLCD